MTLYLDTSALVKQFIEEADSALIDTLMHVRVSKKATSRVTYVEMHSALSRRFREDRYPTPERAKILRRFEADWNGYTLLEVTDDLVRWAADLSGSYRLRAYDALHLASALTLERDLGRPVTFAAFDASLNRAAKKVGLTVLKG